MREIKIENSPNKYVINFLLLNGFYLTKDSNNYYNGLCQVIINQDNYEVKTGEGSIYSKDLNIYWIIGLLTWNNYIPKNYKHING
jgi:hypothetical protein